MNYTKHTGLSLCLGVSSFFFCFFAQIAYSTGAHIPWEDECSTTICKNLDFIKFCSAGGGAYKKPECDPCKNGNARCVDDLVEPQGCKEENEFMEFGVAFPEPTCSCDATPPPNSVQASMQNYTGTFNQLTTKRKFCNHLI